jgi:hypothetical protein
LNDAEDIHLDGCPLVNQLGRLHRPARPNIEKRRLQIKAKTLIEKGTALFFIIVLSPLSEKNGKKGTVPFSL